MTGSHHSLSLILLLIFAFPGGRVCAEEGACLLLTKVTGEEKMTLQIKSHDGRVLDSREVRGREKVSPDSPR
ncbi:MAG: hypothetical protein P1U81_03070 [Verrucomicrobiales bacterium]|nr:hypothetical protein [Verrucomicrobiales bacterium]